MILRFLFGLTGTTLTADAIGSGATRTVPSEIETFLTGLINTTSNTTTLSGRILDTNDFVLGMQTPVVGASISLLGLAETVVSNANGNFLITQPAVGNQIINIDSSTANPAPDGSTYAGFRETIDIV